MNDDLMFDYLLQMGAMRPEQEDLKRRQAMVDALRQNAMEPGKGQMVSGHYVPKGIAGALGQLGTAYMAKQGQGDVDKRMGEMNAEQRRVLEELRRRRRGESNPATLMFNNGRDPTFGTDLGGY